MKNITKLLLAVLLAMGMFVSVSAEENEVIYNGEDIVASGSSSLHDAMSGLEPGVTREFTIKMTNISATESHWYIENEVLNSLEDSKAIAKDGGYTYKIEYTAPDGTLKVLFDSSKIGGDEQESSATGLKQATESTKDEYFFIDTLKSKESGLLKITIGLDGESQPNSYMDTKADFEIRFAVETDTAVPTTGDTSKLNMYTALFAGSMVLTAACLGYLIVLRKRQEAR